MSPINYAYKKGTAELKGLSPLMAVRPTFLDGNKTAGLRDYELTDHLSNVMAVISDRKLSVDTNNDNITDYYSPQVVSFTDYYPFGFPMAERSGNLSGYRFGFNGQEADREVYGTKQSYNFEFRNYDTRLGRWWGVDPKYAIQSGWSSYKSFLDNPIVYVDMKGRTEYIIIINVNKNTGKTWIEVKTSNWVMTDGEERQIADFGGGYYYATNYYNYQTVIVRTIGDNGKILNEKSKSQILYNEKRFSKGFIFDPDDKGRRLPWFTSGGGINFTAQIGQGEETRKGKGNILNVNIDLLLNVISMSMKAGGGINPENIANVLSYLVDMMEIGYETTEAVQQVIKDANSGKKKAQSKDRYCRDCHEVTRNGKRVPDDYKTPKDTINYEDHRDKPID